jgi:hypothetical protein
MSEKSWTYEELTAETKRTINFFLGQAGEDSDELTPEQFSLRSMARGCFLFWSRLTNGRKDPAHRRILMDLSKLTALYTDSETTEMID